MENKSKIYSELVHILRVAENSVKYEGESMKSQLLKNVAETLKNLTILVQNIRTDIEKVEVSRQLECNLKNEAYYFIIENNLLSEFKSYLERTRNK